MTSRPVTFVSQALTLEGVLHEPATGGPSPAVAVCHPHPLYGGDMQSEVVVSICERLAVGGIAALRFNFRGVGRSEGSFGGGEAEQEDVRGAVTYLRESGPVDSENLGLVGYSFGAAVALSTAEPGVRALAAVSPPLAALDSVRLRAEIPLLVVAGDRDEIAGGSRLAEAASARGGSVQVTIIPGADHFWWGHLDALAETVAEFFMTELS